jgi:hypothetical protein
VRSQRAERMVERLRDCVEKPIARVLWRFASLDHSLIVRGETRELRSRLIVPSRSATLELGPWTSAGMRGEVERGEGEEVPVPS